MEVKQRTNHLNKRKSSIRTKLRRAASATMIVASNMKFWTSSWSFWRCWILVVPRRFSFLRSESLRWPRVVGWAIAMCSHSCSENASTVAYLLFLKRTATTPTFPIAKFLLAKTKKINALFLVDQKQLLCFDILTYSYSYSKRGLITTGVNVNKIHLT